MAKKHYRKGDVVVTAFGSRGTIVSTRRFKNAPFGEVDWGHGVAEPIINPSNLKVLVRYGKK